MNHPSVSELSKSIKLVFALIALLCLGCRSTDPGPAVVANDDWQYYGWDSNAPPLLPVTNAVPEIIWRDPEL